MKRNVITKPALAYLISGLLLTLLTPLAGRYFFLPDTSKGFLSGLGLVLEVIAIVKLDRNKKGIRCTA